MFPTSPLSRRRILGYSAATLAIASLGRHASGTFAQDATPVPNLGWSDTFSDNGLLNVATTVAPISSIVRNIGGDRINLHGIVPDGTNSHTFEPAPSDAKILANADVLIAIWDGEDGNGKAGTADTVETAIRRNIPVIWISADAPHEAVPYEPLAIGRD